jgi:hypothetical protein
MSYQGWSNYETWCVALWINNEEPSQNEAERLADEARENNPLPAKPKGKSKCTAKEYAEAVERAKRDAAQDLAEQLKNMIEEFTPDLGCTVFADLLTSALGSVDWYEIAESLLCEGAWPVEECA